MKPSILLTFSSGATSCHSPNPPTTCALSSIQKNAKAYQESFLEDRAAAAAAQDITAEQAIKIILQREGTTWAYQTLQKSLKPGQFSPLTEVYIERPDQSIEIISDPNEMFRQIIARDSSHYNQAEGTPCTKQPVKAWLGASGITPICNSMLNGSALPFVPGASPAESQLLLDQLPCSTPPTPIDDVVTIEDCKFFFGKWSETTSTSKDRHLGHWKALISNTAKQNFPEHSDMIIGVLVSQLNLSLQHGHAWTCWKRVASAKIPKRAGNMLLNKLRNIHLFEADFNWLQGLIVGQ
jgi:hypothetical protein